MSGDSSQTAPGEPLLRVEGLRTWFPIKSGVFQRTVGHVRAVDGVDITVHAGETVALVGESGCGKTTAGRSLLRLIEPREGVVFFEGRDLLKLPKKELRDARRTAQMVFQDPMSSLNPRLRVRDIIAEGMDSFGIGRDKAERTERVAELLERVQLKADHMSRYPHEFSGGQRQRIGIARALSVEPRLLVLDEAVSALDVSIQAQVLNLLSELQRDLALAYLFITHDLSVVRYLAKRVCVMYLGQVVEEASAEELFRDPQHPYTRGLLSAIPSIDPDRRGLDVSFEGDVPSSANPPSGCRFHTRCPQVMDRCRVEEPQLIQLSGRQSRCFLREEGSCGVSLG